MDVPLEGVTVVPLVVEVHNSKTGVCKWKNLASFPSKNIKEWSNDKKLSFDFIWRLP